MNIDTTITQINELHEGHFSATGLCEAGFDIADLKELVRQRNELLEKLKDINKEGLPAEGELLVYRWPHLSALIQSCEGEAVETGRG